MKILSKTNRIQVLIVEDDPKIASLLKQALINNGFTVLTAFSANDAEILLHYFKCNLIILDYMLGEVNGYEFLTKIRTQNNLTPVIMLTALNEIDVKLKTLSGGADDYITKPFHIEELILRIKNILQRTTSITNNNIISFCNMQFNKLTGELKKGNDIIPLSTQEEQLLQIFTDRLGEVVTKEEILASTKKALTKANLDAINVSIMRLRKAMGETKDKYTCLKTIRNQGFSLKP